MGRIYSVTGGQSVAASATETQLVISAPAVAIVALRRIRWGQVTHVTSEQFLLEVMRATAAGSGGSTPVPEPKEVGDPVFGGAIINGPTTEPTYTADDPLFTAVWNSVLGGEVYWPEGERPLLSPSGIVGIRMTAGALLTTFVPDVHAEFEEIGG